MVEGGASKIWYGLKEAKTSGERQQLHWGLDLEGYAGTPFGGFLAILYLMSKHTGECAVLPKEGKVSKFEDYAVQWAVGKDGSGVLQVPEQMIETFQLCTKNSKVRFIIAALDLRSTEVWIGHANFLIYDKADNTIERFEPYGAAGESVWEGYVDFRTEELDRQLKIELIDKLKLAAHYLPPLEFCPRIGPQLTESVGYSFDAEDPGGFCAAWSLWYTDLRMSNPHMSRGKILKEATNLISRDKVERTFD